MLLAYLAAADVELITSSLRSRYSITLSGTRLFHFPTVVVAGNSLRPSRLFFSAANARIFSG